MIFYLRMFATISLTLVSLNLMATSAMTTPVVFDKYSFQQILQQRADKNFIVILWSLDCPPCIEELPAIKQFHQQHPELEILMIAADDAIRHSEISQLIQQHQLADLPHWVFSHSEDRAIRYSIDPQWYGELPRSYLYQHGNLLQALSGRMDLEKLMSWRDQLIQQQTPATQ